MKEPFADEAKVMYERLLELLSDDEPEEKSDEIYKPFAGHEDFDSCVSANSDKDDPEAYCAQIHYNATGEWPGEKSVGKSSIFRREWHQRKKIQEQAREMDNECSGKVNDAIKEQVWPDDLNKSPTWQDDDDVTQQTQEWVESVFELRDPLYNEYADIPETAGLRVTQVLKDALTQPQGWSLNSIVDELSSDFGFLPQHRVEKIVRQEVAAVLNEAEIVSLQARADEPTVKWVGPDDQSTTDLCKEIKDEVGDGVPLSELLDILEEKARKYKDEGGTPQRADQGVPHYLCRHAIEKIETTEEKSVEEPEPEPEPEPESEPEPDVSGSPPLSPNEETEEEEDTTQEKEEEQEEEEQDSEKEEEEDDVVDEKMRIAELKEMKRKQELMDKQEELLNELLGEDTDD